MTSKTNSRRPRHRTIIDFDPTKVYSTKVGDLRTQPGLSKTIPEILAKYSRQSPMQVGFNPAHYTDLDVSMYDGLSKTDMSQLAIEMEQRVRQSTAELTLLKSKKAAADAEIAFNQAVEKAVAKKSIISPNLNEDVKTS